MANKDGSLGPANNYNIQERYFDALGNAFNQLKNELNMGRGMTPIEDLDGLTMRFLGRSMIQLNHVKYIVADPYTISKKDIPIAEDFLNQLVKELKKRYKLITGDDLTLTEQTTKNDIGLWSKISPDRSWALGGAGTYQPNLCRFNLTTSRIYHVETKNLKA